MANGSDMDRRIGIFILMELHAIFCNYCKKMCGLHVSTLIALIVTLGLNIYVVYWILQMDIKKSDDSINLSVKGFKILNSSYFADYFRKNIVANRKMKEKPWVANARLGDMVPDKILQYRTSHNTHLPFVQMKVYIQYKEYTVTEPWFIYPSDREIFLNSSLNFNQFNTTSPEGQIWIISNGYISDTMTCSYLSDVNNYISVVEQHRHIPFPDDVIIVPLIFPSASSFLLFVDLVIPKLVQIAPVLKWAQLRILLHNSMRDPQIYEILDLFGVSKDRILFSPAKHHTKLMRIPNMLNTCITPPFHPALWRKAQQILGVPGKIQLTSLRKASVILLTRHLSKKYEIDRGRTVLNQSPLYWFLKRRYGNKFITVNNTISINQSKVIFSKARIVLGVHGSEFFNSCFSPCNTTVIEIIPVQPDGYSVKEGLIHPSVWRRANSFGQSYIRLYEMQEDYNANLRINLNKLKEVLDIVDETQVPKTTPTPMVTFTTHLPE